jgi:alpha-methylacyl-CoA racemase
MNAPDDSTRSGIGDALRGVSIVSIALNLPGPFALRRLVEMGATATKVEPPGGDPLQNFAREYYRELHQGVTVLRLDLKETADHAALSAHLDRAQLLLTSQRPQALARLTLDWPQLHARWPHLNHVAIVGHAAPRQNEAGHDLTYVAQRGLLRPPHLPPTLMADLAGAERAVSAALALLRLSGKSGSGHFAEVALEDAAHALDGPLRHGLTAAGGLLGGGFAGYNLYQTADGWIALAALEPHFLARVLEGLGLARADGAEFSAAFKGQSSAHWLAWARKSDIPLTAIK